MAQNTSSEKSPPIEKSLRPLLSAVVVTQFFLPFMVAGVAPLLPKIGRDLDASATELSFVLASYILALAIMHLVAGRISDMFGRKRILLLGLAIFGTMLVILPFSPSMEIFLVFRFIQALGTAMINTSVLAILVSSTPPNTRGKVLGVASIGIYLGLSIGPSMAGFVATVFTWHAIFYGLIPLCIFAWCVMFYTIKGEWYDAPDAPFDWAGAILYTMGITAFTLGSIWILEGWWAIALALAGIAFLGIFILVERRVSHPILDVYFLTHNRAFVIGAITAFLNYASIFGMIFYISLYLQIIHKMSVLDAGLLLSVQPVTQVLLAPLAGRLGDRFGGARVSTLGMMLCGFSLWVLGSFDVNTSLTLMIIIQISMGIGCILFVIPNTSDIMGSVDAAHLGQASGIVGTVRTLGMLVCMMVIALSMNLYLGSEPLSSDNANEFLSAMQMNFRIFSFFNIVGVLISLVRLLPQKVD